MEFSSCYGNEIWVRVGLEWLSTSQKFLLGGSNRKWVMSVRIIFHSETQRNAELGTLLHIHKKLHGRWLWRTLQAGVLFLALFDAQHKANVFSETSIITARRYIPEDNTRRV
jgi:hypothetical protein